MKTHLFFYAILLMLFFWLYPLKVHSQQASTASDEIKELIKQARKESYTNPEKASARAKKAYEMSLSRKYTALAVDALTVYGWTAMLEGDFDLSLSLFYDALEICPADSLFKIGTIENVMSHVYRSLGNNKKALEFVLKGTEHFRTLNDSTGLANSYNYHGLILLSMKQTKEAESLFYQALKINRALNDRKSIAANINNLCMLPGNSTRKIELIHEAIEINKSLDASWSVAENYNNLGCQYYYTLQYSEALIALHIAHDYAQKIKAKELLCNNYKYRSWIYVAQKDYAMAYNSACMQIELMLELQSQKRLHSKHSISDEKYTGMLRSNKLLQTEHQSAILKKNIVIGTVCALVLIILLLAGIKWHNRKKELKLISTQYVLEHSRGKIMESQVKKHEETIKEIDNKLQVAKEKLNYFLLFLQSRNELLEKIKDMIKQGYKMKEDDLHLYLKKINVFISQYQVVEEENRKLSEQIKLQNREFTQRLAEQFPNLTEGEKNLATLLRMNLSVQEISLLIGVLPKTISMGRHRLRKQLALHPETDLVTFLRSI